MSQLQRAFKTLGGLVLLVAFPFAIFGQTNNSTNFYAAQAGEYVPAGNLPGDQTHSSLALNASGGYLVWQDNITDGDGLGISAVRLDSTFSPTLGNFRVNQQGAADQENPQVALLNGGGAVFVWQSGKQSFQHIMARFLGSNGLWTTGDVQVNTATNYQVNPAVAVLTNGNVIVTWGSYGEDNADGLQGVYGQMLSPTGQKVGTEFRINQFTPYNQRTPAVAALPNGNFLVAWVSELERTVQTSFDHIPSGMAAFSVDIYARQFNSAGTAQGGEFLVNVLTNICANPAIGVGSDGTYFIAWSQKDSVTVNNSWDVWGRQFSKIGVGGAPALINTQVYGDQYAPKVSSIGTDYLVVWTSMGQDGSREGVYGQFLHGNGSHVGGELRVNTTVLNQQMFPAVASDGVGRFMVSWSSYVGGIDSLDLNAQRYATTQTPLTAPGAPIVLALDSYSLSVTWPPVAGFSVSYYELFVDGSSTPINVTNNMWSYLNYNPSSTHTFQLAYVLTNGNTSPLSATATGTTWGVDRNFDGLPDDWEAKYYGTNQANWPKGGASTVLAPGVTLLDVFLSGANPSDPSTWLKETITKTSEGYFLNWNTIPGGIYQVRGSTDLQTWTNLGSQRFEAGNTDSIYLGLSTKGYYQVLRNRY
ncbi:MAG TPA: hypothetical protein VG754_01180 [Verrucomicrobiae bacterium]|nr:hypothetical protein [Verrucomicrobiae bacterium]